jgi:myo-inositol-1(or 4)-monophosphatase
VAEELARAAGRLVAHAATRPRPATAKGRANWVTATDRASEALILAGLGQAFPGHAVLAEESRPDTDPTRGYVWVVDPLDGTRNFISGIPLYCVSIALLRDGRPLLGVTYDPNRERCLAGGAGRGVRLDGRPVRASRATRLADAVVVADLGYHERRARLMQRTVGALLPEVQAVRTIGSAALGLAWTAAGAIDLFLHGSLYPWDVAAALALVPAAGGAIADRDGGPARVTSQGVVAGAPAAVREFLTSFGARPWR